MHSISKCDKTSCGYYSVTAISAASIVTGIVLVAIANGSLSLIGSVGYGTLCSGVISSVIMLATTSTQTKTSSVSVTEILQHDDTEVSGSSNGIYFHAKADGDKIRYYFTINGKDRFDASLMNETQVTSLTLEHTGNSFMTYANGQHVHTLSCS